MFIVSVLVHFRLSFLRIDLCLFTKILVKVNNVLFILSKSDFQIYGSYSQGQYIETFLRVVVFI